MHIADPKRTTMPRKDAVTLRNALEITPATANLAARIEDTGEEGDKSWLIVRAPKDKEDQAIDAAWAVAKDVLGNHTPRSVIGFIAVKDKEPDRGR